MRYATSHQRIARMKIHPTGLMGRYRQPKNFASPGNNDFEAVMVSQGRLLD
jgi:hypothetical protein